MNVRRFPMPVNSFAASCFMLLACLVFSACTSKPLVKYSTDSPPIALLPISHAGISDDRARFREIFCAVLESHGENLPDYRPCEEALTTIGLEPEGTGREVYLGPSKQNLVAAVVPGVGWDCIDAWLGAENTAVSHVQGLGYDAVSINVDGLSGSANNARQIRDHALDIPEENRHLPVVLVGYSKGTPDILEAIVTYPELRERVVAVMSVAGAVGGSPIANSATQDQVNLMRHFPGAECEEGDGGALDSLRPATRQAWLAQNQLPDDLDYYSLVTFPTPDRISNVLSSTYNRLSYVDSRNDGQLLFYDQLIPGSSLLGYLNGDHWAVVIPIARTHSFIGSTFANKNDFPREAMLEALLRFIEEDLEDKALAKSGLH